MIYFLRGSPQEFEDINAGIARLSEWIQTMSMLTFRFDSGKNQMANTDTGSARISHMSLRMTGGDLSIGRDERESKSDQLVERKWDEAFQCQEIICSCNMTKTRKNEKRQTHLSNPMQLHTTKNRNGRDGSKNRPNVHERVSQTPRKPIDTCWTRRQDDRPFPFFPQCRPEHLPSTEVTAMEKKMSQLNVKRNVSDGEKRSEERRDLFQLKSSNEAFEWIE